MWTKDSQWRFFFFVLLSPPHPSYQSVLPLLYHLQLQASASACHSPLLTLSTYVCGDMHQTTGRARGVCQQACVGFWVIAGVPSLSLSTLSSSSESDAAHAGLKRSTNRISLLQAHLMTDALLVFKGPSRSKGTLSSQWTPRFLWRVVRLRHMTTQHSTEVEAHIGIMSLLPSFRFDWCQLILLLHKLFCL